MSDIGNHLSEEEVALCAELLLEERVEDIPDVLRNHLKGCVDCADQVLILVDIVNVDIGEEKSRQDLFVTERGGRKVKSLASKVYLYTGIAAAIFVLLSLGLFLKNREVSEAPRDVSIALADSGEEHPLDENKLADRSDGQEKRIAEKEGEAVHQPLLNVDEASSNKDSTSLLAYDDNPVMEKLVQRYQQGHSRSQEQVKSQSIIRIRPDSTFFLKFRNSPKEMLLVEIFDAKGNLLAQKNTDNTYVKIDFIDKPDNYYWKLMNDDFDLLFCGKIICRNNFKK
ncbi:MAG: hypothetical protein R6U66_13235 [Bacteroidales bacterium]|jgi:hypothetical protein